MSQPNNPPGGAPYGGPPPGGAPYGGPPPGGAPYSVPPATPASPPGKVLGIVAIVLAFLAPVIGLILGLVANSQSKKVGFKNTPAVVGIVLGAIFTIVWIVLIFSMGSLFVSLFQTCGDLGPGQHVVNGVTITCG